MAGVLRTAMGEMRWHWLVWVALLAVTVGCSSARPSPHGMMRVGKFDEARDLVESQVVNDRSDRRYMLDRMRAGVLNLDAGDINRSERWFAEVYDVLRIQGLNDDKTIRSVVLTEGVKVWKGEPFEQAMALVYYGFVQASQGSWDNARAAAANALFYLRDFDAEAESRADGKERIDVEAIARRAAEYEAKQRGETDYESGDDYLDNGYIAEENNFTMAYLLHGIASQQLGRADEASDYFNRVLVLNSALRPLVEQLRAGDYNTIVVVADGLGPRKVATGPGGALSRYKPIDRQAAPAQLVVNGSVSLDASGDLNGQPLHAVTDLNQLALDHRWNNLEDVRVAKNVIGDLALISGAVVLGEAASNDDGTLAIVGAGLLLGGAIMKATARANTDYCDVFPQRLFVAALNITEPGQSLSVELGQGDFTKTRATLSGLDPPAGPYAMFHYLRAPIEVDLRARYDPDIPAP